MARLQSAQSAQTSPDSESPTSSQLPVIPSLQARRRNSRESLLLAKQQSDPVLKSARRHGPLPPLSITIPTPDSKERGRKAKRDNNVTAPGKLETASDDDDVTPREKVVSFSAPNDAGDHGDQDDDSEARSAQSSICQSPSWEGYGRNKQKKKLEAQLRKREKELAEQELRAKKKLGGGQRLFKQPPLASPATVGSPPTSAIHRFESQKSSSNQSIKSARPQRSSDSQQNFIPAWGIAVSAGGFVGGTKIHQPYSPSAVKALIQPELLKVEYVENVVLSPASMAIEPPFQLGLSKAEVDDARKPARKAHVAVGDKSGGSMTMPNASLQSTSYPPQSSRTHALRLAGTGGHVRSNSASAVTSAQMEEASKFFKAQNMKSSQGSKPYANTNTSDESLQTSAANERGRPRDASSYVRQSRAQSAERSLSGFMAEASVSSMPPPPAPWPGSSQSRLLQSFPKHNDEAKAKGKVEDPVLPPNSPTKPTHQRDGEQHTDYFTFVNKPYTPPSVDLMAGHAGFLSSIKSRMSRRNSSASSGPQNGKSFRDRAIGAMHLTSHPSSSSRTPSETNIPRSVPSSGPPTVYSPTLAPEEFARLPKAARVLGEFNAETMQSAVSQPGSRPSEGSSTSSYHDDSSGPPSSTSTPDTSRPQSARGLSATIDEIQKDGSGLFLEEVLSQALGPQWPLQHQAQAHNENTVDRASDSGQSGSKTPQATTEAPREETRPTSKGRLLETDRPNSKGRPLDYLVRPKSRGRQLDDFERPDSKERLPETNDTPRPTTRGKPFDVGEGLKLLDEEWSRSALPIDIDAQSFVTSLTNQDAHESTLSLVPPTKADAEAGDHSRPGSRHSRKNDDGPSTSEMKDRDRPHSRNSRTDKKAGSGTHAKQMSVVNEEPKAAEEEPTAVLPAEYREGQSIDMSFPPPPKHEALPSPRPKLRMSIQTSAPSILEPHRTFKSPLAAPLPPLPSASDPSLLSPGRHTPTPSAVYLQEARRSAPLVSSPLSSGSRPKASSLPAVMASRPGMKSATVSATRPALLPPNNSLAAGTPQFHIPAQEPEQLAKPMAKMLVECCSCHFFHDMPSRVYECMASPDAVVTDRALGVSGAITTMVKCPWCSHNMSTSCCAGYAALVYLKERMH